MRGQRLLGCAVTQTPPPILESTARQSGGFRALCIKETKLA
jgi:hypothetical protein